MKWSMRKAILVAVSLCAMFCAGILNDFGQAVEARARVSVAEREMKKSRDYQKSDLYERARRIIYGQNPPSGPEGRVRIAVVVDGDGPLIVENRVKDEIYSQIRKKFPREEFAVMKGTDVMTKLLQHAEEMDIGGSNYSSGGAYPYNSSEYSNYGGYAPVEGPKYQTSTRPLDKDGLPLPPKQPNGIAYLKREDFVRAGRECDYDYIFAVTVSDGDYYKEKHNFILYNSATHKKSIWLRVRFVDMGSGDYLYRRDVVAHGETGGATGRARMFQSGVREAMKEVLDDISVTY